MWVVTGGEQHLSLAIVRQLLAKQQQVLLVTSSLDEWQQPQSVPPGEGIFVRCLHDPLLHEQRHLGAVIARLTQQLSRVQGVIHADCTRGQRGLMCQVDWDALNDLMHSQLKVPMDVWAGCADYLGDAPVHALLQDPLTTSNFGSASKLVRTAQSAWFDSLDSEGVGPESVRYIKRDMLASASPQQQTWQPNNPEATIVECDSWAQEFCADLL